LVVDVKSYGATQEEEKGSGHSAAGELSPGSRMQQLHPSSHPPSEEREGEDARRGRRGRSAECNRG